MINLSLLFDHCSILCCATLLKSINYIGSWQESDSTEGKILIFYHISNMIFTGMDCYEVVVMELYAMKCIRCNLNVWTIQKLNTSQRLFKLSDILIQWCLSVGEARKKERGEGSEFWERGKSRPRACRNGFFHREISKNIVPTFSNLVLLFVKFSIQFQKNAVNLAYVEPLYFEEQKNQREISTNGGKQVVTFGIYIPSLVNASPKLFFFP